MGWGWWQMYQDDHPCSPPGGPTHFRLFSIFAHMADGCKRKPFHSNKCPKLTASFSFSASSAAICCSTPSCTHALCALTALSIHSLVRLPVCEETQPFPLWVGSLFCFVFSSTTSLISFCRVLRHLV